MAANVTAFLGTKKYFVKKNGNCLPKYGLHAFFPVFRVQVLRKRGLPVRVFACGLPEKVIPDIRTALAGNS
ncbi:MAG: hypothetical protein LBJ01_06670 [Tannerella sp.]|jgi:hypothetical protein|nr:hypothetical protein [Tannerella sp.]